MVTAIATAMAGTVTMVMATRDLPADSLTLILRATGSSDSYLLGDTMLCHLHSTDFILCSPELFFPCYSLMG